MIRRLLPLLILVIMLVGCGTAPPPAGSLQEQAAAASARADVDRAKADEAIVQAKQAAAELEIARKRALAADQAAVAKPTPELIEAAAKARIEVARAEERTIAAKAYADGLEQVATQADAAATAKAAGARLEREADAKAADLRQWTLWCRLIGLGCTLAGAVLGLVLARFATPREGAIIGGSLIAVGQLVVAYGATITWLPLAAATIGGLALAAWILIHEKTLQVSAALSRTVDALEGTAKYTIEEAKAGLTTALGKTGLRSLTKARAAWRKPAADPTPQPVAPPAPTP